MKTVIFAAALLLGGAAIAQDTTGTTGTTGTGTTTDAGQAGTTSATGGSVQAPSNAAPERDARGIAVISAEAVAPPGYNQPAQIGQATPTPTVSSMGAAGDLPPCSRKVTDHCRQTYERGAR